MANTGSVGKAVSNFLNAIGLQVEVSFFLTVKKTWIIEINCYNRIFIQIYRILLHTSMLNIYIFGY